MSLANDIIRNYDSLKVKRIYHDHIVQDIIDYIAPFYPDIIRQRPYGSRRTYKIFDSTATYGSFVLSQFIQGSVCNSSTRWFGLKHSDETLNEKQEVATCFKMWTTAMLLAFRQSNFYQGNGQAINSWVNMGNGPLICESVPQTRHSLAKLCFTSVPFGKYVMAEGPDGKIDLFIYSQKIAMINAVKMFKPSKENPFNKGVSPETERAAEKAPYEEIEFLHAIQPRENIEADGKTKRSDQLPWASCWVEVGKKRMVRESGYRLFPVAIARYDLISGEAYGRGPSEMALPDARTTNEADRKEMLMWDRQLDPPTLTRRNSIINGVLNKRAGGDTIVSDVERSVKPLFDQPNWQADDMMRKRKEQAILRVYHVNEILNLLAREKPEMTAFEVNARLALLQQIQGPVFGRLEQDYLATIVNVTLDNMAHANMLIEPPDEIKMGGTNGALSVTYEGPLAKAQRSQEIQDIQQGIADIGGIQQFDPDTLHLIDFKKIVRKLFDIRGTQDMLLNERDFEKVMQQVAQQKQQQEQMQMAAGTAQAAGQVAPFLKAVREGAGGGGQAAA